MGLKINEGNLVLPNTSGNGLQVDVTTPVYPFRDLKGLETVDIVGTTRPSLSAFRGGAVRSYSFLAGDEMDFEFHVPHDFAAGKVSYIHVHWSHNGTTITGNVVFTLSYTYAKGHNQANFGAEKSQTITYATTDIATTPQYVHRIDEIQITDNGGTGNYLDYNAIEPDGILLVNLDLTTLPTITGGSPNGIFVFTVDLHYESTGIGTKNKAPNFYT